MSMRILWVAAFATSTLGCLMISIGLWGKLPWPLYWSLVGISGIAAAGFSLLYIRHSWLFYTAEDIGDTPTMRADLVGPILGRLRSEGLESAQEAVFLIEGIRNPKKYISRLSERVELLTRSISVQSTLTIRKVPENGGFLPVLLSNRGLLVEGMQIRDRDERRLSTLSRDDATIAILNALRSAMRSLSDSTYDDYIRTIEPDIATILMSDEKVDATFFEALDNRMRRMRHLAKENDRVVSAVRRVLLQSKDRYAVIVRLPPPDAEGAVRLTTRHRVVPILEFGGKRYRKLRRLIDELRILFGIQPTVVGYPLENAERAASYHLDVLGPERTYLARQALVDIHGNSVEPDHHLQTSPRLGQRHGHVYARNATDMRTILFKAHYYERMPGSMAPASISALSVAVLTWLGLAGSAEESSGGSWEYAALILGFPAAVSLWAGFSGDRRLLGGVLSARVGTLTSISLAAFAATLEIRNVELASTDGYLWWIVALLSSVLALISFASWLLRSKVQAFFALKSA